MSLYLKRFHEQTLKNDRLCYGKVILILMLSRVFKVKDDALAPENGQ